MKSIWYGYILLHLLYCAEIHGIKKEYELIKIHRNFGWVSFVENFWFLISPKCWIAFHNKTHFTPLHHWWWHFPFRLHEYFVLFLTEQVRFITNNKIVWQYNSVKDESAFEIHGFTPTLQFVKSHAIVYTMQLNMGWI